MANPLTKVKVLLLPLSPNVQTSLNLRFTIKAINKMHKRKLERVGHTCGWVNWSLDEYHQRFKLNIVGLNPHKDVDFSLVSNEELESVFGKRRQNGWKVKVDENLTATSCFALLKLYEVVYVHLPPNGDYLTIFMHG
jgi:hypothetical protein